MRLGICNSLLVAKALYLLIDTVLGALSPTVTVTNSKPVEGTSVSFVCMFSIGTNDTLTSIVWSFGPQLQGAARIVHWWETEPNIVSYNHGYASPVYQMTIGHLNQGKTVLTINPLGLHDAGSHWCNVVVNGSQLFYGSAAIQVMARPEPTVHVYLEGFQIVDTGTRVKFFCNYTKSPTDTLTRLDWSHGFNFESSQKIVDFQLYDNPSHPAMRYYAPYRLPGYEAAFDEVDHGVSGYSSLTINSARLRDRGRYWCAIEISRHIQALVASVDMSVIGIDPPTTTPPTTTLAPTTTRPTTTTMATTRRKTTLTKTAPTTQRITTKVHTTTETTTAAITTASTMQKETETYHKRTKAYSKILTGVILAAIPALIIVTIIVCVAICRFRSSAKQTTQPIDDSFEKPTAPPELPPKGIPPNPNKASKGYEDLVHSHRKKPRAYQRLINSFAMAVGSAPIYDYPEYEYPEPHALDRVELGTVGNKYHEYSPVADDHAYSPVAVD